MAGRVPARYCRRRSAANPFMGGALPPIGRCQPPPSCYASAVSPLLLGLLGALVSTNQPATVSNLVAQATGVSITIPDLNDPVEQAFRKVMMEDDTAQNEVDQWIKGNTEFGKQGAAISAESMAARIRQRFDKVKAAYEEFLLKHPDHARALLAYGSFLNDIGEERAAIVQSEKAREADPSNPAAWNNLANLHGHNGGIKKAFDYYAKAIELNPKEPVYYQNFATSVFLFRKDAREHFGIEEQEVFTKALGLYEQAMKLDPENFLLATDWASSYYGIKPPRNEDALKAWEYALKIARDDIERQGVQIHLARFKTAMEKFDEARVHLELVKHEMFTETKRRVVDNLERREKLARTFAEPVLEDTRKP